MEENKKKWSELGILMTTTIQGDWKQERLRMNLKHEGKILFPKQSCIFYFFCMHVNFISFFYEIKLCVSPCDAMQ